MPPLLKTSNIVLIKGKTILKGISFSLDRGEILTVLGPSGSGKSSLLRCLNRLETIDSGNILLEGVDVETMQPVPLRRRIGMLFQTPALPPGTVAENIRLGPDLHKRAMTDGECETLLARAGLDAKFLERQVDTLSVGEQQRVALAQVLANRPDILLLDEPTSGLDPTSVRTIEGLIRDIHRDLNTSVIWVTHDVAQAKRFGARTLVLMDGEIHAEGKLRELMDSAPGDRLNRFFRGTLSAPASGEEQGDQHG